GRLRRPARASRGRTTRKCQDGYSPATAALRAAANPKMAARPPATASAAWAVAARTSRAGGSNLLHLRDAGQAADGITQAAGDGIGTGQDHFGLGFIGHWHDERHPPTSTLPLEMLAQGVECRRIGDHDAQ